MKLQSDLNPSLNAITAYGPGYIEINRQRYDHPVLVQPEGPILTWDAASLEVLEESHFAAFLDFSPELVLLGTGERQRFPHPRLLAPLARVRIGLETMDTRAACRTYNILMSEGRRVLAALLPP